MTRIKICGITREEEIEMINQVMPEYIGFVFAESRRKISTQTAKRLISKLDPFIRRVGVFVDQKEEEIDQIAKEVGLDIVQIHHNHKNLCKIHFPVWQAYSILNFSQVSLRTDAQVTGHLFDTFSKKSSGGNGICFDWTTKPTFQTEELFILAGGLNSQNVRKGISIFKPDVVDVSSGVEKDGQKSYELMKEFIEEVRRI